MNSRELTTLFYKDRRKKEMGKGEGVIAGKRGRCVLSENFIFNITKPYHFAYGIG
jgi:hypothetical protein